MSTPQRFPAAGITRLAIGDIGGDLLLRGWAQEEIQIRTSTDAPLDVELVEGALHGLKLPGDCVLRAPHALACSIEGVGGDGQVVELHGQVQIRSVHGDLLLRDVGPATVQHVGGDLVARQVHGPLDVDHVGGDATLVEIHGPCRVQAGGDVAVSQVRGPLEITAGGDVSLRWQGADRQETEEAPSTVLAGGDIVVRLPTDANVTLYLQAGGTITSRRLPQEFSRSDNVGELVLGEGTDQIRLTAGGDITLVGRDRAEGRVEADFDFELGPEFAIRAGELAQQITEQVESQVEMLTRQLDERLSQLGTGEEIAARVQQKVQQAMRRAEEKIAEAMRKAEKRAQDAERSARRHGGRRRHVYAWPPPPPPPPPKGPAAPRRSKATEEERMMILRMVEAGKISVEQAEQLLAALES
ncbi:MAG: hypothetical protein KatS3mg050_4840 [Litorilinea sp.]|nr:MAG: hypothetical protein KatS3mg050_4840 [Litorilinea sp.]